jgi:hypothetical protein
MRPPPSFYRTHCYGVRMSNPLVIPVGYAHCIFSALNTQINRTESFSIGALLGDTTETLATNLAAWFASGTGDGYCEYMSEYWTTQQVQVIGNAVSSEVPAVLTGLGTFLPLPRQNAIKIKKVTGGRGKANKGYMYWFGQIPSDQVDDAGNLSTTVGTHVAGMLAALDTAVGTDGSAQVILHHANSSVTTPTPVTGMTMIQQVRTQRRRQTPRP